MRPMLNNTKAQKKMRRARVCSIVVSSSVSPAPQDERRGRLALAGPMRPPFRYYAHTNTAGAPERAALLPFGADPRYNEHRRPWRLVTTALARSETALHTYVM